MMGGVNISWVNEAKPWAGCGVFFKTRGHRGNMFYPVGACFLWGGGLSIRHFISCTLVTFLGMQMIKKNV